MDIEKIKTCPLGHKCQEVVDGKIHECMWYVKIAGEHPQTKEPIEQYNCAIAWEPILLIDGNTVNRGVVASIETMRNETVVRQDLALGKMGGVNGQQVISDQ